MIQYLLPVTSLYVLGHDDQKWNVEDGEECLSSDGSSGTDSAGDDVFGDDDDGSGSSENETVSEQAGCCGGLVVVEERAGVMYFMKEFTAKILDAR